MRLLVPHRARLASALALACTICIACAATRAAAQDRTMIHVRLADSSGAPVAGAEVTVLRGFNAAVGHAASDSAGDATIGFAGGKGEYQIEARKIGYTHGDRVVALDRAVDTATYAVSMQPIPHALDSVRVSAARTPREKDLSIDADEIAASPRPLRSAWDILVKLRPDMLRGRSGACGGVQDVWINDERVREFVIPSPEAVTHAHVGVPRGTTFSTRAFAILNEIDPLHVATMVYHDCDDVSVNAVRAQNALFITLKQGVVYVPGEGSVVLDDAPKKP